MSTPLDVDLPSNPANSVQLPETPSANDGATKIFRRRRARSGAVPEWIRLAGSHEADSPGAQGLARPNFPVHLAHIHEIGMLFMAVLGESYLMPQESSEFYSLTSAQKKIVLTLALQGPQRMGDIAYLICSSMPAASAVVDRLESLGLVLRQRNDADRRVVRVSLSDGGLAVFDSMSNVACERLGQLLDLMDQNERSRFEEAIALFHGSMQSAIRREASTPEGPPCPLSAAPSGAEAEAAAP